MQLNKSCETVYLAEKLILTLNFYVGGYLRVQIDEEAFPRFKLKQDGIGAKVLPVDSSIVIEYNKDNISVKQNNSFILNQSPEKWTSTIKYTISLDSFKVEQSIDG